MADTIRKPGIALVRGPIVYEKNALNNEATPAIGFAYIAGYLHKKGYETCMVDAIGEGLNRNWPLNKYPGFVCQGLPFDEIISLIPKDSDAIGFSGMFSGEWPILRDLITETRKYFPKALFVAGGEHVTALPEYSLRDCPALDVCVRGEGEHTFYKLLEAYFENGRIENINGISYLDEDGRFHQDEEKSPRIGDIDEIPWPYWPEGYLEKFWAAEKSFGVVTKRDMPFMFSRGCPYQCTFCSNPQMWTTSHYKLRNIDDIVDEVKYYIKRYDITSVQLYDLTAIVRKEWIVEFCQRVIREGIKLNWSFPSGTRSEALDKETLGLLKAIGCNYLVYAPESGSESTVKMIKKRIHLNKLTASMLEAKRQGLILRANLIIGFPGETWRNVFETLFYGLRLSIKGVDEIPVFIFSPYPGTEIFKKLFDDKDVVLSDTYYFTLTSLNSNYLSTQIVSNNPYTSARMLGLVRVIFNLTNYAIGYCFYPYRILRTIRNFFSEGRAATVFEHRLKDLFKRKGALSP